MKNSNFYEGIITKADIDSGMKQVSDLWTGPFSQAVSDYLTQHEPVFSRWIKESSEAAAVQICGDDKDCLLHTVMIISQAKLESFLIAYAALKKFWKNQLFFSNEKKHTLGDIDDYNNWLAGMLPDRYYRFTPGKNQLLTQAKKNHKAYKEAVKRVSEFKELKVAADSTNELEAEEL